MEIKVGDRFTTNKGGDVVVVEYVQADKIIVEFTDSNKHRVVTTKTVLLKGDIKIHLSHCCLVLVTLALVAIRLKMGLRH